MGRRITGHTAATTTVLALALTLHAENALADAATGDGKPLPNDAPLPLWSLRFSGGGGIPLPGTADDLVRAEGYGGLRWLFSGAVERRITGPLGAGATVLFGWRNTTSAADDGTSAPGNPIPHYAESYFAFGAELPITFELGDFTRQKTWFELALVPWVGLGAGQANLYGEGRLKVGPAFGANARAMLRGRHGGAGLLLGVHSLRVPGAGGMADVVDFGMFSLSLVGGFDVG
jgi:hypothetical protein